MAKFCIFNLVHSWYCSIVFIIGLALGYLAVPKSIFHGFLSIIGVIYIVLIAIVITCLTRTLKDQILNMKKTGAGLLTIIASTFGLGAMHVCGVGAPMCGATIGAGILSILFPHAAISFFSEYSIPVILVSIVLQVIGLYYMGCLKECISKPELADSK